MVKRCLRTSETKARRKFSIENKKVDDGLEKIELCRTRWKERVKKKVDMTGKE